MRAWWLAGLIGAGCGDKDGDKDGDPAGEAPGEEGDTPGADTVDTADTDDTNDDSGGEVPARDDDGDGYPIGEDCDDRDRVVYPGAEELCDELDNDCDGAIDEDAGETWYADGDGDGYGGEAEVACEQPAGHVAVGGDCADGDAAINPGAEELCDAIDNDCDSSADEGVAAAWYADGDGDGYGAGPAVPACAAPAGHVLEGGDCDDLAAGFHPGAAEECGSGADEDCDGLLDCEDGACVGSAACPVEICDDGGDNDADGALDCEDDECWLTAGCAPTVEVLSGRMIIREIDSGTFSNLWTSRTITYGWWTSSFQNYFSYLRSDRLDAYSVSGVLRLPSAGFSCLWQVGHAQVRSFSGAFYHRGNTNWHYDSGRGEIERDSFQISSACPVASSAFLPTRLRVHHGGGEYGAPTYYGSSRWWYYGALARSGSTAWSTDFSSSKPGWDFHSGSWYEATTYEIDTLAGGEEIPAHP